jgi:hypothetical protein
VGPLCPEKDYTYWIEDIPVHYTVQAVTRGFAHADFAWSLGGAPLPIIGLSEETIANVEITHTTPGPPAPATVPLTVRYVIQLGDNTSTLQFWNDSFPGNGFIDISVVATESNVPTIQAAVTETWPLNMLQFDMDNHWNDDVRNCQLPSLLDMANSIQKLGRRIFVLKNTPDPQPDQLVALAIDAERFSKNLQEVTGGSTGLQTAAAAIAASMISPEPEFRVEAPALPGGLPTRTLNRPGPQEEPNAEPNFPASGAGAEST